MSLSTALLLVAAWLGLNVLVVALLLRAVRKRSPAETDFSAPGMPYAGIIEHAPLDLPHVERGRR